MSPDSDPAASPDGPRPTVAEEPERELTPLLAPVDGVPPVITTETELLACAEAIRSGTGPVALDAERASGYRYGQKAYLVQLRRQGSGTWLIDPVALPDLSPVNDAIGDAEWILHAATQDLVCLAEVGLRPQHLFDTELGGRLAGRPRVGLGAIVEHYLGLALAKEHSAVDWSTRPLLGPWLTYAALDVEVLGRLRDAVADDLEAQGKTDWAQQEFDNLLSFTGPPERQDPWRRTSGVHKVRNRRGLAIVREMWLARDRTAQSRDTSPGRIVPDAALVELAIAHQRDSAPPRSVSSADARLNRSVKRNSAMLIEAITRGLAVPEHELPLSALPSNGPPPPRAWAERDPVAAARLTAARELLTDKAESVDLPVENLLTPELLRRLLWEGADAPTAQQIDSELRDLGARPWQAEIAAPLIAEATQRHPAVPGNTPA